MIVFFEANKFRVIGGTSACFISVHKYLDIKNDSYKLIFPGRIFQNIFQFCINFHEIVQYIFCI